MTPEEEARAKAIAAAEDARTKALAAVEDAKAKALAAEESRAAAEESKAKALAAEEESRLAAAAAAALGAPSLGRISLAQVAITRPTVPPPGEPPRHPQDNVGRRDLPDTPEAFKDTSDSRRVVGLGFFGVGFLVFVFAVAGGLEAIDRVQTSPIEGGQTLVYVKLGVHAAITIAEVFFAYTLIRAGERMFIPRWLLRGDAVDVEVIRAMLGIDTPISAATKLTKEVGEAMGKVVEPVISIFKK